MKENKVWIVTGTSGGLGLAVVQTLIKHGIRVAAFSRNSAAVEAALGHGETDKFIALSVNLYDESSVQEAKARVLEKFGTVDVVVNNAGHGQRGAIEEVSDEEARKAFDANFFSQLNMLRNFLPVMRENGGGYIVSLGSEGSFKSKGCSGIYCATKFAVDALTEALNQECAKFNIRSTCVKPFDIRTNYLAYNHIQFGSNEKPCYAPVRERNRINDEMTHGSQPGDPLKVAELFIKLAEEENPPYSMFLNYPVEDVVHGGLKERCDELDQWEHLANTVEF